MNILGQKLIHSNILLKFNAICPVNFQKFCTEIGTKSFFDELVSKNKVVIFIKGTPEEPRCGFSNAVIQIMRMHGVTYDSHNVLDNEKIRQGIKEYSDWPTIPQVYFEKELVGGCDILLEMHQNGDIIQALEKIGIKSLLENHNNESKPS